MSTYDGAYQDSKVAQSQQPDWLYPKIKKSEKCEHKRKDTWNHGYHAECLDCGEQLY